MPQEGTKKMVTDGIGRTQTISVKLTGMNMKFTGISEAGLYSAILRSRKPEAKAFKRWITHKVIPHYI
ncbi:Bro-N domain-containing protein [Peribacillus sp. FSL E2-0159]|uniref:BRO-N domain-containing protein n=1 Tax=Peribacillus sp. FSL E2-0159 TaxID=2975289 RepID=UPI00315A46FA